MQTIEEVKLRSARRNKERWLFSFKSLQQVRAYKQVQVNTRQHQIKITNRLIGELTLDVNTGLNQHDRINISNSF